MNWIKRHRGVKNVEEQRQKAFFQKRRIDLERELASENRHKRPRPLILESKNSPSIVTPKNESSIFPGPSSQFKKPQSPPYPCNVEGKIISEKISNVNHHGIFNDSIFDEESTNFVTNDEWLSKNDQKNQSIFEEEDFERKTWKRRKNSDVDEVLKELMDLEPQSDDVVLFKENVTELKSQWDSSTEEETLSQQMKKSPFADKNEDCEVEEEFSQILVQSKNSPNLNSVYDNSQINEKDEQEESNSKDTLNEYIASLTEEMLVKMQEKYPVDISVYEK